MSLPHISHIDMPSITQVLEASHGSIIKSSLTSGPDPLFADLSPNIVAPPLLMKRIDFRDGDLENEQEEPFYLVVGFPEDLVPDDVETGTISKEKRGTATSWGSLKFKYFGILAAFQKLLPVKLAKTWFCQCGQSTSH